jgi:phage-related minor tail protein
MENALVGFVKTGKINFSSLTDQMIEDVARLSYKMAMSGLLNMLIGGGATNTSGMGGILGSLFKTPSLYAKGDVFDSPTAFSYGGGRTGVMAEDGPEAVVPLARGRDGKLGIAGGSGSNVTILPVVYNNSGKVTARTEVQNRGGQIDIKTIVEDIVIDTMTGQKGAHIMGSLYGVRQQAKTR